MTFAQRSVSRLMCALNWSGVPPTGTIPACAKRSRTSGAWIANWKAPLSFSMMSLQIYYVSYSCSMVTGIFLICGFVISIKLLSKCCKGFVGNLISFPVLECLHFPIPGEKSKSSLANSKCWEFIVRASVFTEKKRSCQHFLISHNLKTF